MEINQEKIETAIIEQAVEQLVGNEDIYSRVKVLVDQKVSEIFEESAEARIQDAVSAAIEMGSTIHIARSIIWAVQ